MCKNSSMYGTSKKYTLSPNTFRDAVEKEVKCINYGKKIAKFTGLTLFIIGSLGLSVIKEKCE